MVQYVVQHHGDSCQAVVDLLIAGCALVILPAAAAAAAAAAGWAFVRWLQWLTWACTGDVAPIHAGSNITRARRSPYLLLEVHGFEAFPLPLDRTSVLWKDLRELPWLILLLAWLGVPVLLEILLWLGGQVLLEILFAGMDRSTSKASEPDFYIFVRTYNAGTRQLQVNGSHTVQDLHQRINEFAYVPDFYLTREGKVLDAAVTLLRCGISKDDTVVQRPRIRAGNGANASRHRVARRKRNVTPDADHAIPAHRPAQCDDSDNDRPRFRCAKTHSQRPGLRGRSSQQICAYARDGGRCVTRRNCVARRKRKVTPDADQAIPAQRPAQCDDSESDRPVCRCAKTHSQRPGLRGRSSQQLCAHRRDGGRCITAWLAGSATLHLMPLKPFPLIARLNATTATTTAPGSGARKPTASVPGCGAALPNKFVLTHATGGVASLAGTASLAGSAKLHLMPTKLFPLSARLNATTAKATAPCAGARKPTASVPGCGAALPNSFVLTDATGGVASPRGSQEAQRYT